METPDDDLFDAYRAGDAAAFEVLYDRHHARLVRFVMSLGAVQQDAEDIGQETWMKAIRQRDTYRAQGRFQSWLFRIAHRSWLDRTRSAWHRRTEPAAPEKDSGAIESMVSAESRPDETAVTNEESARLREALDRLPAQLRETLLLRIDGGLTFREIADAMDCPVGTALWRGKEAQRRLKEMLGEAT